jgi:hypothetical protein
VGGERRGQLGAHLDDADAGLGLGVGDVEAGAGGIVEADLADVEVAQLAAANAAVPEDAHDERLAGVAHGRGRHSLYVPVDRRLRAAERGGDVLSAHAAVEHLGDLLGDRARAR